MDDYDWWLGVNWSSTLDSVGTVDARSALTVPASFPIRGASISITLWVRASSKSPSKMELLDQELYLL